MYAPLFSKYFSNNAIVKIQKSQQKRTQVSKKTDKEFDIFEILQN